MTSCYRTRPSTELGMHVHNIHSVHSWDQTDLVIEHFSESESAA